MSWSQGVSICYITRSLQEPFAAWTLLIYPAVEMGFEPWACSALQWGQSGKPGSLGVLLLANLETLSRSLHLCGLPVFLLLCIYILVQVSR